MNAFSIKLSSATHHKNSITYNICTQCGQIKRKRICHVEWLCFALLASVYWILNMHDKYSLVICGLCSWVSACVWSIVFIPNMAALNLGKHFYLLKQSSACNTKRLITVFWLLLCQSVHHCWRGLEQKKKTPPAHFTASLSKCTCKENHAQREHAACRSSVCTRNNRRVG